MPTLVSIDGHHPGNARPMQIAISLAHSHAQNVVADLVAHWLEVSCHHRFAEDERCVEGDLAAAAFYDKLSKCFDDASTFVAALMFPKHSASARVDFDSDAASGKASPWTAHRSRSSGAFSEFVNGNELARWMFSGRVRAHLSSAVGVAQVVFDELPGGIAFESRSKSARIFEPHAHAVTAWYGFGTLIRPPAAAIGTLRDAISVKKSRARALAVHHV